MGKRFGAGRVLSAANETKLREARDSLDVVLAQISGDDESARALNRAPTSLGPGYVRVAKDEGANEAEVFIFGDIGGFWDGVSADDFAKDLAGIDVDTINVRLNSPGGVVFDGLAIYGALARHKAKVNIHIDGIAASIASVIAMAGDEIRISEGSRMMIHKPWSFAMGDSEAMRKEADILDGLESDIIDLYEARTDQQRADLEKWVADETWLSARDAVDKGFADVMIPAKKKENRAASSAMLALFRNTPQDLLHTGNTVPAIRDFEAMLRDGEGLSHQQAKRVAALASRSFRDLRDEDHQPREPRDEDELAKLAAKIRSLI